jgi:hypothetical protein
MPLVLMPPGELLIKWARHDVKPTEKPPTIIEDVQRSFEQAL